VSVPEKKPEIPRGLPPSVRNSIEQGLYGSKHPEEKARYLAAHPELGRRIRLSWLWIAAAGLLGLLVWLAVIAAGVAQKPGLEGWLNGIFSGLLGGLLVMLMVLLPVFVISPFFAQPQGMAIPAKDVAGAPDAELDQTLAELEAVRQQALSQVPAPRPQLVLAGAVAGLLFFIFGGGTHPLMGFLLLIALGAVLGALAGYGPAALKFYGLDTIYGDLYLQRVLPKLLARFGPLNWRRPAQPPLAELGSYRLFPQWNQVDAGNEIHGDYRGLPLSIFELTLVQPDSARNTVFDGLLVTLTLSRGLRGITVVTPSQGVFGQFIERWREHASQAHAAPSAPLQPVRLEDPEFAQTWQVHAADQISSRALLTPAFMERFKALAQRLGAPALLVRNNRLIIALATGSGDFFLPPSFHEPATARARLTQLREDIATLLRTADAVIDLDQSTRQQTPAS
jgi:hypothetical protein